MISNLRRGVHSLQVRMACADSSREYEHVKWPSSQKQLHGDCHGLQMKRGVHIETGAGSKKTEVEMVTGNLFGLSRCGARSEDLQLFCSCMNKIKMRRLIKYLSS